MKFVRHMPAIGAVLLLLFAQKGAAQQTEDCPTCLPANHPTRVQAGADASYVDSLIHILETDPDDAHRLAAVSQLLNMPQYEDRILFAVETASKMDRSVRVRKAALLGLPRYRVTSSISKIPYQDARRAAPSRTLLGNVFGQQEQEATPPPQPRFRPQAPPVPPMNRRPAPTRGLLGDLRHSRRVNPETRSVAPVPDLVHRPMPPTPRIAVTPQPDSRMESRQAAAPATVPTFQFEDESEVAATPVQPEPEPGISEPEMVYNQETSRWEPYQPGAEQVADESELAAPAIEEVVAVSADAPPAMPAVVVSSDFTATMDEPSPPSAPQAMSAPEPVEKQEVASATVAATPPAPVDPPAEPVEPIDIAAPEMSFDYAVLPVSTEPPVVIEPMNISAMEMTFEYAVLPAPPVEPIDITAPEMTFEYAVLPAAEHCFGDNITYLPMKTPLTRESLQRELDEMQKAEAERTAALASDAVTVSSDEIVTNEMTTAEPMEEVVIQPSAEVAPVEIAPVEVAAEFDEVVMDDKPLSPVLPIPQPTPQPAMVQSVEPVAPVEVAAEFDAVVMADDPVPAATIEEKVVAPAAAPVEVAAEFDAVVMSDAPAPIAEVTPPAPAMADAPVEITATFEAPMSASQPLVAARPMPSAAPMKPEPIPVAQPNAVEVSPRAENVEPIVVADNFNRVMTEPVATKTPAPEELPANSSSVVTAGVTAAAKPRALAEVPAHRVPGSAPIVAAIPSRPAPQHPTPTHRSVPSSNAARPTAIAKIFKATESKVTNRETRRVLVDRNSQGTRIATPGAASRQIAASNGRQEERPVSRIVSAPEVTPTKSFSNVELALRRAGHNIEVQPSATTTPTQEAPAPVVAATTDVAAVPTEKPSELKPAASSPLPTTERFAMAKEMTPSKPTELPLPKPPAVVAPAAVVTPAPVVTIPAASPPTVAAVPATPLATAGSPVPATKPAALPPAVVNAEPGIPAKPKIPAVATKTVIAPPLSKTLVPSVASPPILKPVTAEIVAGPAKVPAVSETLIPTVDAPPALKLAAKQPVHASKTESPAVAIPVARSAATPLAKMETKSAMPTVSTAAAVAKEITESKAGESAVALKMPPAPPQRLAPPPPFKSMAKEETKQAPAAVATISPAAAPANVPKVESTQVVTLAPVPMPSAHKPESEPSGDAKAKEVATWKPAAVSIEATAKSQPEDKLQPVPANLQAKFSPRFELDTPAKPGKQTKDQWQPMKQPAQAPSDSVVAAKGKEPLSTPASVERTPISQLPPRLVRSSDIEPAVHSSSATPGTSHPPMVAMQGDGVAMAYHPAQAGKETAMRTVVPATAPTAVVVAATGKQVLYMPVPNPAAAMETDEQLAERLVYQSKQLIKERKFDEAELLIYRLRDLAVDMTRLKTSPRELLIEINRARMAPAAN